MQSNNRIHIAVATLFSLGAGGAMAAEAETASVPSAYSAVPNSSNVLSGNAFESSGIPIAKTRTPHPLRIADGVDLFADAEFDAGYDSNVKQSSRGNEVGSLLFRIRPTISAQAAYRADRYVLSYLGDYVRYPSYDPNSLGQNDLILGAQNVFTGRAGLAWQLSAGDHYDPIGSTDRTNNGTVADHYRTYAANTTFRYGAEEATGRVELDAGIGSKRYLNDRINTESADVDNMNLGARFYYKIAPKTRLLTEVRRTTFDYKHDTRLLQNTDMRYLLGASWDATAVLAGSAKVGLQAKNYVHDEVNPDYKGLSWEAALRWKPLTYSSFDLISGRAASDPSGSSSGVPITKNLSLAWNHDWMDYVHSKLSAGRQRTRYTISGRKDVDDVYSASIMYDMRRWLGLGAEFTFSHRNSNDDTLDYIRRQTIVKIQASF
ncbi:outer membrane beta-barrel protein [Uliginosibacterium gangwonense]|uniref:outer membrane beta-barrel protein n=1 Tax=Uliginosibacterium gangwonense TaxID=392736 RepID=UPI00037F5F2D|nr:outer membrane beta-barrel protein [Uliginosibacterium gangwonense]